MPRKKPTFVSLFSGCGGFDLGFKQAGFKSLGSFDIDPTAVKVHIRNIGANCFVTDLQKASLTTKQLGRPDVVISGSPCQGFSNLGKRNQSDVRNRLLSRGAEIAVGLQPEVVVLENVMGVLSPGLRAHFDRAISILEGEGYQTTVHKIKCSDYGVPQIRKRVLVVASLNPAICNLEIVSKAELALEGRLEGVSACSNHEPVSLKKGTKPFRIAKRIAQHQKLCNVRGGDRAVPTWEIPEVFGPTTNEERAVLIAMRRLRRQVRLRPNGDADPLTITTIKKECGEMAGKIIKGLAVKGFVRQIGRRYDLAHTFNGKYRRLSKGHPSPAVDTRFGTPGYFLHPEEHRGFSVREAARIQGFPDNFIFEGPLSAQYRLVGNAVPPPVAKALAMAIKRTGL